LNLSHSFKRGKDHQYLSNNYFIFSHNNFNSLIVVVGKNRQLKEFKGILEETVYEAFTYKNCEVCNCFIITNSTLIKVYF